MNRKVRNLLASVVLGVCLFTLSFIPSFAANSANSASVGNVEAMKEIASIINEAIENKDSDLSKLKIRVKTLCAKYPLYTK